MRLLRTIRLRVRSLVQGRRVDQDLDAELRDHMDRQIELHRAAGLSPADARAAALREFGNIAVVQEQCRDTRGLNLVEDTLRDLRYAFRSMRRAPGYTAVAALSLALAIGVNTAIFSIVDAVLLRPLPYPDAGRLVRVDGVFTRLPLRMTETGVELAYPVTAPEIGGGRAFVNIGAYSVSGVNLGNDGPQRLRAAAVTPGFFAALNVRPPLGHAFTDTDVKQTERIAVISDQLWRRRFGADPLIVGRSLVLNGRGFLVSGVMPAGVDFPDTPDIWIPRTSDSQIAAEVSTPAFIARLAPNVTALDAREEVLRLIRGGALTRQDARSSRLTVTPLRQALVEDVRPILLLVGAAALLVLVVACMNTANLLLARVSARERELAVRRAMGASTPRLVRQVLCESLLLAAIAGAVAVPVALWALVAIRSFIPPALHGAQAVALNARTFAGLAFLSLLTAAVFGMAPAISVQRRAPTVLRGASSVTPDTVWRRFRSALVVLEIAAAVALLAGAATIVRTLGGLMAVDLGARNETALVMEVTLPRATYASSDRIREFYDRLRRELRSLPGIAEVGATNHLPGSTTVITPSQAMVLGGQPLPSHQVDRNALRLSATPGYFAAIGIDVLAGRAFTEADRPGTTPVAIVSEGFARAFELQPVQIIGRRVNAGLGKERLAEIIGVVRDVRMRGPESDLQPAIYVPVAQTPINATGYVVTKAGSRPKDLIPSIRQAVGRIDSGLPLYNLRTFGEVRSDYLASRQFAMATVIAFGTVACGLAVLGLYGVISYMVRLRTREIGIRIAIGASPAVVRRQVIGSGVLHATGGMAIGIASALGLSRFISAYVPGLGQVDPAGLAALTGMTFIVSIGASWFPARRAARVDPLVALRYE